MYIYQRLTPSSEILSRKSHEQINVQSTVQLCKFIIKFKPVDVRRGENTSSPLGDLF